MQGWFTIGSVLGLGLALLFAILSVRNLPRAILVFLLLGLIPTWQIGGFSGRQIVQGLLLVQVLGTVLIFVWLVTRARVESPAVVPTPFNRWLFALPVVALASLGFSLIWRDPTVDPGNINVAVSIGQVLLYCWPIGLYLVVAASVPDTAWVKRFTDLVIYLSIPQVAIVVVPELDAYLFWSRYLGLLATPLAVARALSVTHWGARAGLAVVALLPLMQGLGMGKAFLYGYVSVAIGTVLLLAARRLLLVTVPLAAALVALLVLAGEGPPGRVQQLIDVEREQQSWGGRAGRVALAQDAVAIWSDWPILGVGPGNSYAYMLRYSVIGTPHNQYLDLLVEVGLIGLGVVLAFVVSAFRFGLRLWRRVRHPVHKEVVLGWLGAFAALAAGGLTGDFLLHSIRNGGLEMFSGFFVHWVFLGVAVGISRLEAEPGVEPVPSPAVWHPFDGEPVLWSGRG